MEGSSITCHMYLNHDSNSHKCQATLCAWGEVPVITLVLGEPLSELPSYQQHISLLHRIPVSICHQALSPLRFFRVWTQEGRVSVMISATLSIFHWSCSSAESPTQAGWGGNCVDQRRLPLISHDSRFDSRVLSGGRTATGLSPN